MKELLVAEWERLWKRKVAWLTFLLVPVVLLVASSYLKKQNRALTVDLPQYTFAGNFPVLSLAEMLFTVFNAIFLVFITLVVTGEYRSGQLRMVMIRSYSFKEIILAKAAVILLFNLLFFITYFCMSYVIGFLLFEHPQTYFVFYHSHAFNIKEALVYNLSFYGYAYLTTIAICCVLFFISVISKTTTTAVGIGVAFILISFSYPNLLTGFRQWMSEELFGQLFFTSIPMIQWQGITVMMAEKPQFVGWNFGVLGFYVLFFSGLTYVAIRKKESFL
ncbi:ABC transporter permease [Priestia megaterium]|uniref:ABC transporter permease n=1 Tax=Priestia megaterium TaxID=1404 RepID=UPI002877D771|nr:ABC transporter permease [Priestia megaterium]MBX4159770.1 ABC transporter permease [Priestia megaterium]